MKISNYHAVFFILLYCSVAHSLSLNKQNIRDIASNVSDNCKNIREKSIKAFFECPENCELDHLSPMAVNSTKCEELMKSKCSNSLCDQDKPESALGCRATHSDSMQSDRSCNFEKVYFENIEIEESTDSSISIQVTTPPIKTDVYFLADTTGSMNEHIGKVILSIRNTIDSLKNISEISFGAVTYEDERDLDGGFEHQLSLTKDGDAVRKLVTRWRTADGADSEEATLVALYKVATEDLIGWRIGSRKFVVLFAGAPGHEPTCYKGKEITRNTVITALKRRKITVVAVNFGNIDSKTRSWPIEGCGGKTNSPEGQATSITSATGGSIVSEAERLDIDNILKNLSKTFHKIDVDTSLCDEELRIEHMPLLPIWRNPSKTVTIKATIRQNGLCNERKRFACVIRYSEGNFRTDGEIRKHNITLEGC